MKKWYEDQLCDQGIVISSRIRLARNIKKYPFPVKISEEQAKNMIDEVKAAIMNERTPFADDFKFIKVNETDDIEKTGFVESHVISPVLANKRQSCGVLLKSDNTISIMVNEEDHIRIQTMFPGEDIDKAWDLADKIDNLIEERIEYAFSEEGGYITACPTNMGTGLRASFMLHLPAVEKAGQLRNIVTVLGKFGITVRGTYGEGTEALGSIYQISNQLTLGQSEEDIIKNLKNAVTFVKEQEEKLRASRLASNRLEAEDEVYRAYGVLTNARKITAKEAFDCLSKIRYGFMCKLIDIKKPTKTIYDIMINIQPAHMQSRMEVSDVNKRDEKRAEYLRDIFKEQGF